MQKPPLIEYIPYYPQEEDLAQVKRVLDANVYPYLTDEGPYLEGLDEWPKQSPLIERLAELFEEAEAKEDSERWNSLALPHLAIADDQELQRAVLCFKEHLDRLRLYSGMILDELERRQKDRDRAP